MSTEEVFPCFFTVVFPAENGGVSEEDDTDGNDVGTNDTDVGRESSHGEGYASEGLAVSTNHAEDARGSNGETSDGANNDGINESTGHGNITLSCWMVSGGSCSGNSSGTKTSFVGEATTSDAVTHSIHDRNGDGTHHAAFYSRWIKSHHENQVQTVRNVFNVQNDASQTSQDVEHSHARNNHRRYFGNRSDTADDNGQGHDGESHTHDFTGYTERSVNRSGNGVGLGHVADTEGSQYSEESEGGAADEAGFLIFEAVLHSEHRAAFHLALGIDFTEFEAQETFREFGGQTEASGNPHPNQSARAACKHSGGYADDITSTNGSCQSGHQSGERRYVAAAHLGGTSFLRENCF